jgi:hypothetical protein
MDKPSMNANQPDPATLEDSHDNTSIRISIGERINADILRQIETIEANIRTAEQLSGSIIVR